MAIHGVEIFLHQEYSWCRYSTKPNHMENNEIEKDKRIETIGGMAEGDELHPLQQKFIEHVALQCGICTPGLLIAAKHFLEENPDPTAEEVRYGIAGNLCRCTGYQNIINAIMDAAAEMRGT